MISDRIRIAMALAVTASCGAHQVAVGLSGEPVRETPETVVVLPESEPTVETSLYMKGFYDYIFGSYWYDFHSGSGSYSVYSDTEIL